MAFFVATATYAQTFTTPQGQGSEADPYKITNIEELYWVAMNVNYWSNSMEGKYFAQQNDIDASATAGASYHNGQGWEPIGDSTGTHFKGNYDGKNYAVDGLYINRPNRNCAGLFGFAENGSISNLGMTNADITADEVVAPLVAFSRSTVSNCYATGTINADKYAGGLIGVNDDTIRRSYSNCTIQAIHESGGFVGASIKYIEQCYSLGKIYGEYYIGGFVGSKSDKIINCYSHTQVERSNGSVETLGSFAGLSANGQIDYCYATGLVSYQQGIVPRQNGFCSERKYGYFRNNLIDTVTSQQSNASSYYATLSNTGAMNVGKTFAEKNWDFKSHGTNGIWNIGNGRNNGYPYFDWEFPGDPDPILHIEPEVATHSPEYNGGAAITIPGNVTELGSPQATDHGICWANTAGPDVSDNVISNGSASIKGSFSLELNNVAIGETYYFRAYITSDMGTFYGSEISVTAYPVPAGSGTENDPYLISNLAELNWISIQSDKNHNGLKGLYFVQVADIDAGDTKNWDNGKGWKPIGDKNDPFHGNYSGKNHTISNLYINRPAEDYIGLFGNSYPKLIDSLHVVGADITGGQYVGSIAGKTNGTIRYCTASGTVTGTSYVGGVYGLGTASYVAFTGTVSGISNVGGVTGDGDVSYSCADADVSGQKNVGGLTGSFSSFVKSSYSRSSVTRTEGTAESFGSLAGLFQYNYNNADKIHDAYATGPVTYQNGTNPVDKGLIGLAEPQYSDYALSDYAAEYSMWDSQTSGQASDVACVSPYTTAEMTDVNTFLEYEWEFKGISVDPIWNIGNGRNDGYPYLNWLHPNDLAGTTNAEPIVRDLSIIRYDGNGTLSVSAYIFSTGQPFATEHGVCWSTSGTPTTADTKYEAGAVAGNDTIKTQITGLRQGQICNIRAYITNSLGTFYSEELSFYVHKIPSGDGSEANPYLISSLDELMWVHYQCNLVENTFEDKFLQQTQDIDVSDTRNWNGGEGWEPIYEFKGSYLGENHVIDGLYINRPRSDEGVGLFSNFDVGHGRIYNLGVTNADVTGFYMVGTLMGRGSNGFKIYNSYSTGTVHGYSGVGGLVGESHYTTMDWCYSTADVYGYRTCGGLTGTNVYEPFNNCYSRGNVYRVGEKNVDFGGLVGLTYFQIDHSYSTGKVIYQNGTSPTNKGFAGSAQYYVSSTYDANFWDIETSGQSTDSLGFAMGRSTAEMKMQQMYEGYGWDFHSYSGDPYWMIDPNKNDGYPYFSWQKFPETPVVTTNAISNVTAAGATLNGAITDLGATNPTAHGFCWGETEYPTIASATVEDFGATSAIGTFNKEVSLTDTCAIFYVRAFATNPEGTGYGSQKILSLDDAKPVITWDNPNYIIFANPATNKGTMPDFSTILTVDDNCGEQGLSFTQTFTAGSQLSVGKKFSCQVIVSDKAGNKSIVNIPGEVQEQVVPEQEIILAEGWNLVSLYLQPADAGVSAVFPDADGVKTLEQFYRKGSPLYLNSLIEIEAGKGYLVKNQKADTLTISGSEISGSVELKDGWNLTGVPSGKAIQFDQLPANVIIKDFKEFYINGNPASQISELESGKAYFIKK